MQFLFSLAAAAMLSGLTTALPTLNERQTFPNVPVTFNGAAGFSETIVVVANAIAVPTNIGESITSISMEGRADFTCVSHGIDGSITNLVASEVC